MQDKRRKTMGYTKIREGNQKYQKLQGKEVKHVGSRIVADERHRKKMMERIINNFREASDRFAPATSSRRRNYQQFWSSFGPFCPCHFQPDCGLCGNDVQISREAF
ncbi:hypothetical protein LXL04_012521 [Taraxacum kok-saghyz]